MIQSWYEIWANETYDIPYILLLCPSENTDEGFLIIDPQGKNAVIQKMADYESAMFWLCEDEYTLVDGRMILD